MTINVRWGIPLTKGNVTMLQHPLRVSSTLKSTSVDVCVCPAIGKHKSTLIGVNEECSGFGSCKILFKSMSTEIRNHIRLSAQSVHTGTKVAFWK